MRWGAMQRVRAGDSGGCPRQLNCEDCVTLVEKMQTETLDDGQSGKQANGRRSESWLSGLRSGPGEMDGDGAGDEVERMDTPNGQGELLI